MRYILLRSDDFAMFHQDIDLVGYEFYYRHKETFRRMYNEQGKEFWVRFMLSFRSAQSYDILRIFNGKIKCLSDYIDSFFINVHEEFIDGHFSRAKQLFEDIVKVAEDQGYLSILHLNSLAKNPFHRKDTKDIYRRFFGKPTELSSYSKVFVLLPMYRRLAGSLCVCLRRWLVALELTDPNDKSYWVPPPPVPHVKELPQNDGSCRMHELKNNRVDILKLTITKDDTIAQSVSGKEDGHSSNRKREKTSKDVSEDLDFAAEGIALNSELVERLSSLFHLSNSYLGMNVTLPNLEGFDARFPKKSEKWKTGLQCSCCDEVPPTKATSEARAKVEALSSVIGSAEKEMVQRLHDVADCGDFESFGIRLKRRSTVAGERKIQVKISAAKKEPGMKQLGDVHKGGTAETESQETKELKTKASNKSSVKTKSKATDSKAGKEMGVEKELRATDVSDSRKKAKVIEESNFRKNAKATEKSDAKQDSKATEESGSTKKAKALEKSDARQESKITEESDSRKKAKVTEESHSTNKAKATEESHSREKAKATEEFDSEKKTKATEESDSTKKAKPTEESDSTKKAKPTEESDSTKKAKVTEESDCREKAKATEESDSRKKAKATEESDSRKKAKANEESDSREKAKANEESDSTEKAKATEESSAKQELKATVESCPKKEAVDESEVVKGTDSQEEKESSRPGSKNVRTCMTCDLQEPAPKVFKKCKRCKDEGALDPPYYCSRDCQVSDWTTRHRQEHEKSCA